MFSAGYQKWDVPLKVVGGDAGLGVGSGVGATVEAVPQAVHQDVDAWMQVSVLTGGCTCFSPGVGAWPGAGSSG